MAESAPPSPRGVDAVLAYHQRTKHSLKAYAAGPEALDWDAQPNPFRSFAGAPLLQLALPAGPLDASFAEIHRPGAIKPAPLNLDTLGSLLRYAFGLAAWKEFGPDRWALRCAPSSGNLHPTEAYVVARDIEGLSDGLYHYRPREHALERRCAATMMHGAGGLWIGLSSIHWREAWKYGERALRYCLLDAGHELGALRYSAAGLGWRADVVEGVSSAEIAALLGLDRVEDFAGAEREEPELLISISADGAAQAAPAIEQGVWLGRANLLDPRPMYRWPIVEQAAHASRGQCAPSREDFAELPGLARQSAAKASDLILQRRSAQRFDARTLMPTAWFFNLLDALLPRPSTPPFDAWRKPARLHPVLFVHRVEGFAPGLYILPRRPEAEADLRAALNPDFAWTRIENAPAHLPLYLLQLGDARHVARTIACAQWIASDGCFSLGLLSEFGASVRANAHAYRALHYEAGLLGQALYLEAEAAGFRGTGIGCFFDDDFHRFLGLSGDAFQSLYHFTIGFPKTDSRIVTTPPYPESRP